MNQCPNSYLFYLEMMWDEVRDNCMFFKLIIHFLGKYWIEQVLVFIVMEIAGLRPPDETCYLHFIKFY